MTLQPWSPEWLSPVTVAAVRAAVPRLAESIIAAISAESTVYAEAPSDPSGIGIRLGIEQALSSFLDAAERGEAPAQATDEVWRRLGEAEFQAGRSLDSVRAAFRTGTRAAWRAAAEVAGEVGIETSAVVALAEGIFVYSDALAADVVEGYLRIQSDEAGDRERRRRRLGALLLDPQDHDPEALERAAGQARWPLPWELAVLAVAGEAAAAVARQLDADVLVVTGGEASWLVLPDPAGPGRAEGLRNAVAQVGAPSALGPAMAPRDAYHSLRWARGALGLIERGVLADGRPTLVQENLAAMVLRTDERLTQLLVARRLAPLEELPAGERERLLATLTAWLAHQRHTPAVAAELHVHPQTVRYRLGKLRELLGTAIENPEERFELELALRARALRARQGASDRSVETLPGDEQRDRAHRESDLTRGGATADVIALLGREGRAG